MTRKSTGFAARTGRSASASFQNASAAIHTHFFQAKICKTESLFLPQNPNDTTNPVRNNGSNFQKPPTPETVPVRLEWEKNVKENTHFFTLLLAAFAALSSKANPILHTNLRTAHSPRLDTPESPPLILRDYNSTTKTENPSNFTRRKFTASFSTTDLLAH